MSYPQDQSSVDVVTPSPTRRYFRLNTLKQTFIEDFRLARSWKVIFLWVPKLLRKRMDFSSPIPLPVPSRDFVIPSEQLSEQASAKLAPLLREATERGFRPPVYHAIATLGGETTTIAASCRHGHGELVGRFMYCRVGSVHPPAENLTVSLISRLTDGRLLVTTDQRATFNVASNVIVQRNVGGSLPALCELHRKALDNFRRQNVSPELVTTDEELTAFTDRLEQEAMDHNLRRGLYEELTAEEIASRISPPAIPAVSESSSNLDRAVSEQIERLQNRRTSWSATLLIALLSLAAFIAAGTLRWNWELGLILTAVLIFHEMGHYVAMRLFRYRDVRMFFVPLLGAAVTGRHYNVKGWQQAIVSLAGPIPGIAVALALMLLPGLDSNPWLERFALVSLVLNGINLLPVLPLDGGWVLHALLFSRHFVLETAFQIFAAFALMAATFAGRGQLWMYLGIFLFVAAPLSYRLARLSRRLRDSGITTASPDDVSIPPETAAAILQGLKEALPGRHSAKHLATHTLAVFQKLNATPPGAWATVALFALYLAGGAGAYFGTDIVRASRSERFTRLVEANRPQAVWPVEVDGIRQAGLTNANDINFLAPCLVANFTNLAAAEAAFDTVREQLGSTARLTLLGQSLFLSAHTLDTNWNGRLKAMGAEVMVERPASNQVCAAILKCEAPEDESKLRTELSNYFGTLWLHPWPPWIERPPLTESEQESRERAQWTWKRLEEAEGQVFKDSELRRISQRFGRGKASAVEQLLKEHQERLRALYQKESERFATSNDAKLDRELAALFFAARIETDSPSAGRHERFHSELARRLGALPLESRRPSDEAGWAAARTGNFQAKGATLHLSFLSFYRTELGLPALLDYLHRHGCTGFRYKLQSPLTVVDEEPDN